MASDTAAELMGAEYKVYVYEDFDANISMDEVVEAGIKALGLEGKMQGVETELVDHGHF